MSVIDELLAGKPVRQVIDEAVVLSDSFTDELKSLETDDYQNRDGDYPESGEPDTIDVYKNFVTFSFKNTSEEVARNWVTRFLTKKGFNLDRVDASQTGDYKDDWVEVTATVASFDPELTEGRKFEVGKKFIFRDKYDNRHECTVLSRKDFDEMDPDDYAIGEMTYSYPTLGSPHKETVRLHKEDFGDEYFVSGVSSTGGKSGFGIEHIVKP